MAIFAGAVLVLGGASVLLLGLLVTRRFGLRRIEMRRTRGQSELRPAVLAFLDSGAPLPTTSGPAEQELLVDALASYASKLRGSPRARVAAYLEATGAVAHEVGALHDRKGWRRATAAYRLGDMASSDAVEPLLVALDDEDRDVRAAAARSLGRLQGARAVEPLLAALVGRRIPQAIVRWALLQIGEAALPRLREIAERGQPEERAGAVQMIGLLGDATDAAVAQARLRDTSAAVREQAALALGRLGRSADVAELLRALDDRVPSVRTAAAESLGRLRDERAIQALRDHARRDRFEPARAAAYALARLDPELVISEAPGGGIHLQEAADLLAQR
jgi:HEAT repeat protein